jgi:hypothetical protein
VAQGKASAKDILGFRMAKSPVSPNDRQARLAEALRENLRRRKAHSRQAGDGESAAAEVPEKDDASARRNPAANAE